MVYFSVVPRDGTFEIDFSDSYTNVSSMYALSNKRAKSNLDSALLWHCRLGHISKKRIEKLQHDGLFNSTDLMDFEKYVPCMSGKMARKPYSHQVDRAKDLLGLIYTDDHEIIAHRTPPYTPQHNGVLERRNKTLLDMVRSMMSRTTLPKSFWDYALETATHILNMVLTKKGEYMSQEFLDHPKDHEIIVHRTPPYTPQHNGVLERRNKTLLDMVRSMMSRTTLPKSFWDYALETATHILNMVLTKKVEKTPYEIWHGQAPKLSYLKVWGCEALVKRD
nr:hypothetical protein [Tanacetum cinerariifolium]